MTNRSPRTILAVSAAVALTVAALAPTAAFAKGPGGGNADCDGDCTADQPQAQQQVQARDGSGDQAQIRARDGSGSGQPPTTQANVGGGGQVQARSSNGRHQNRQSAGDRAQDTSQAQGQGRNAKEERQGAGNGPNEDGQRGPGTCDGCDAEMGVVTDEQMAGLVYMANEEKLAHDVYARFAELYGTRNFSNIADAEARHQEAVRIVLERYGMEDPTAELPAGEFSDPIIASLYATLIDQGSVSLGDALAAAVTIEETDIADLENRLAGLEETAPDVFEMYSHLLTASGYHLEAFQAWLS